MGRRTAVLDLQDSEISEEAKISKVSKHNRQDTCFINCSRYFIPISNQAELFQLNHIHRHGSSKNDSIM